MATTYVKSRYDQNHSIFQALQLLEKKIRDQNLIPVGSPRCFEENLVHKSTFDNDGVPLSAFEGIIVQRCERKDANFATLKYAIYPFGFNSDDEWISISKALDQIEKEIQGGTPIGELQVMKAYSRKNEVISDYSGFVVQAYLINELEKAFK